VTSFRLALRGFVHRWRTNLAVALGTALATAVLVGSLGAGDSVRYSLRRITLNRLGRTVYALEGGERFFRAELGEEVAERLDGVGASLLVLRGAASVRGGEVRVSGLQVLGVEPEFWALRPGDVSAGSDSSKPIGLGEVLLNEPLAWRLGAEIGEELLLRMQAPSLMPGEAPLAVGGDTGASLRLKVAGVVPEDGFGDFSLRVSQVPPLNAFVSREALALTLDRPGRANTLLLAPPATRTMREAEQALVGSWMLADAGLSLRRITSGWELLSERVFLEPPAATAALQSGGGGVLTYFVDRISFGERSIAYSFVSAPGAPRLDREPGEQEIVLNTWAARELAAGPGDVVELEFRVPGPGDRLVVTRERLQVSRVVEIDPQDRTLMPEFPGLAEAENCRDWDPGFPIDLSLIGPRDEEYWDRYRGSPRAFVSLAAAQKMWSNRFGSLTGVRFPEEQEPPTAEILAKLPPASLGLDLVPARSLGLEAGASGVDFGSLFLGLSFFLLAASLLLVALLFLLSVEQRRQDIGILAALGFTRSRIQGLLLVEGGLVAAAGGLAGLPLGLAFHRGILSGLRGAWQDAVRTSLLQPYVAPASLVFGFLGGVAASLAVIVLATRRVLRQPPAQALYGRSDLLPQPSERSRHGGAPAPRTPWTRSASAQSRRLRTEGGGGSRGWNRRWLGPVAVALPAAGAAAALFALSPPASFFAAGALLLLACLVSAWLVLLRLGRRRRQGSPTLVALGLANAARRRSQSLAVTALLACGIFVVTAVAANRSGPAEPGVPGSGTGGFALIAETAVPLVEDLATEQGRRGYGLASPALEATRFVGFRVLDGDDASCLNLNRVRQPRILAIDPKELSNRFSFAALEGKPAHEDPWRLLEQDLGPDTIPAIADQTVIAWGLGLEIGDELEYRSERGRILRVRLVAGLANSIFQGNLIVAEDALLRYFPSTSGRRFFLIEAPTDGGTAEIETAINRSLARFGVSLVAAAQRLAEFDSVQDTYLVIFGLLGWLGMLVGTFGLAIVVVRNVARSRNELALLRAVGFSRGNVLRAVLAEHLLPLGLGLGGGAVASALAVIPAAQEIPVGRLLALVAGLLASSLTCTALAAAVSVRSDLLPTLRGE
jgi:putative ABC transport system permease protein